jgi:class 3 adenylate cyclase/tetratricopeptide (TPR) repeat protein
VRLPHTCFVERKLASVLVVGLAGPTALVVGADHGVAGGRITRFFEFVSRCVETHGGTVQKLGGTVLMGVFGVPLVHEDDAERALRAALEIQAAAAGLEVECRMGVEAADVMVDSDDVASVATGTAVDTAVRLQHVAGPKEILVGVGARRLAARAVELERAGTRRLAGFSDEVEVWRAVSASEERGRPLGAVAARLVGRDVELALLRNTFVRTVRDRRPHLVTIYGEPGVGKSRLARDFAAELEGAHVLVGRCLPYGEGVTYWPLAEMVRTSAGIADDDSATVARKKLIGHCRDEAVADLLALAAGFVEEMEIDGSRQGIAWAAREWAEGLTATRPVVLGFEDIHWSEEPLLRLIEHLAGGVQRVPLMIMCLARPELLELYPGWGGGRTRGVAIELGALDRENAEALVDALLEDAALPRGLRGDVLEKTEGNPLFVEETVRMLAEGIEGGHPIPDTVQALIAARIDGLPRLAKVVLQRASVIGRSVWLSSLTALCADVEGLDDVVDALVTRDFLVREHRADPGAEQVLRFKHVLIREIAYSGLTKSARAELHAAFAAWLHERGMEEVVEIRAYHLDRAAMLLSELDMAAPPNLAHTAAAALEAAGMRALAREANRSGRHLFVRAVQLEPTLQRRFHAARAAWRLDDIPAVALEMERVRADAHDAGNRRIEGRALIALGEVTAFRDSDTPQSRSLIEEGLELLEPDDAIGRFDALRHLSTLARWAGDDAKARHYAQQALDVSRATGRKDLISCSAIGLGTALLWDDELERAEELAIEAQTLAVESGGIVPRGQALQTLGQIAALRGETDEAMRLYDESIALFSEAGAVLEQAKSINHAAELAMMRGNAEKAERLAREAIRMLQPLSDRGYLCESQRILAEVLVNQGKLDEAERYALLGIETVGPHDVTSLASTRMALGLVRAAQGRDAEAEAELREAFARAADAPRWTRAATADALARFLRSRGRDEEAAEVEAAASEPAAVG